MADALPAQSTQRLSRDELRARLEHMERRRADGHANDPARPIAVPTGFAELDAALPGGGWPVGAITELMPETQGIGELSLLMPALAHLSRAGRYLAWIAPPCLPYPPALVQHGLRARARCCSCRRTMRAPCCGPPNRCCAARPSARCSPGPQRSSMTGACAGSSSRPRPGAVADGSIARRPPRSSPRPPRLRLKLRSIEGGLHVDIHKARGRRAHALVVHPAAAVCA